MPALVRVVEDGPDASGQWDGLRVVLAIKGKRVVEVVSFLDVPGSAVVLERHARERDQVHGAGLGARGGGL